MRCAKCGEPIQDVTGYDSDMEYGGEEFYCLECGGAAPRVACSEECAKHAVGCIRELCEHDETTHGNPCWDAFDMRNLPSPDKKRSVH